MTRFQIQKFLLCAAWALFSSFSMQSARAQTVNANTGTATATAALQTPTPGLVVADEPYALYEGLVRELRNGGFVLYMRNGAVLPSTADKRVPATLWWQDCTNTQRLAPEAQPRARAIAEALQRQRIIIYEVHSSEFCRAIDTAAHFGLIAARRTPALNDTSALPDQLAPTLTRYAAGIQALLSDMTPPKVNRVLIGHALPANLVHASLSYLPEGNVAVFKAEGNGRFQYVASLSPGQWQWLGKQSVADQNVTPTLAQALAGSNPQVAQPVPTPPNVVLIAPEKELKGVALVQALRRGGFNLYMRHAQSTIGQDGNLLQTPNWWDNCAIQRNMSDAGKEQARKVGDGIKALKIPVDQILTAQFCRTRETGHLLGLGPIEVTEDINHQIGQRAGFDINASRFKRLAEMPTKGNNTILISHTHGSPRVEERIMGGVQEAEIVVYQPDEKGGSEPVARIPIADWDTLIKAMATIPGTSASPVAPVAPAKAAPTKKKS